MQPWLSLHLISLFLQNKCSWWQFAFHISGRTTSRIIEIVSSCICNVKSFLVVLSAL